MSETKNWKKKRAREKRIFDACVEDLKRIMREPVKTPPLVARVSSSLGGSVGVWEGTRVLPKHRSGE